MTDPIPDERADKLNETMRGRVATLPNCDGCGRFTARPTRIDTSWSGGAGMHVCSELLLCPRCATNRAKEMKEAP